VGFHGGEDGLWIFVNLSDASRVNELENIRLLSGLHDLSICGGEIAIQNIFHDGIVEDVWLLHDE